MKVLIRHRLFRMVVKVNNLHVRRRWSSQKNSILRESLLFKQFDLNYKKGKPSCKNWNFSNLLKVLIIPCLLAYLWSGSKGGEITTWNLWHFFWNVEQVEMMVLAVDWGELWLKLLVLQRIKIYFKFTFDEKLRSSKDVLQLISSNIKF